MGKKNGNVPGGQMTSRPAEKGLSHPRKIGKRPGYCVILQNVWVGGNRLKGSASFARKMEPRQNGERRDRSR